MPPCLRHLDMGGIFYHFYRSIRGIRQSGIGHVVNKPLRATMISHSQLRRPYRPLGRGTWVKFAATYSTTSRIRRGIEEDCSNIVKGLRKYQQFFICVFSPFFVFFVLASQSYTCICLQYGAKPNPETCIRVGGVRSRCWSLIGNGSS